MAARKFSLSIILALLAFLLLGATCATIREAPSSAREAYDIAQDDLKKQRYEESKYRFEKILSEYPKSDLADNALFRLGYIACIQGDYENARAYFASLIEDYDNSEWIFDASTWLGLLDEWHLLSQELDKTKAQLGIAQDQAGGDSSIGIDAADRIEELQAEIGRLREENNNLRLLIENIEE